LYYLSNAALFTYAVSKYSAITTLVILVYPLSTWIMFILSNEINVVVLIACNKISWWRWWIMWANHGRAN